MWRLIKGKCDNFEKKSSTVTLWENFCALWVVLAPHKKSFSRLSSTWSMFHFSFEALRKYHFIWLLVSYLAFTSHHFISIHVPSWEMRFLTTYFLRYCRSMNIWITRNRDPSPSVNQIVIVSHGLHIYNPLFHFLPRRRYYLSPTVLKILLKILTHPQCCLNMIVCIYRAMFASID